MPEVRAAAAHPEALTSAPKASTFLYMDTAAQTPRPTTEEVIERLRALRAQDAAARAREAAYRRDLTDAMLRGDDYANAIGLY